MFYQLIERDEQESGICQVLCILGIKFTCFSTETYTIQGNSHGSPCYFPFLYDGQWFHSCTSVGREDGFHWCATTHDYGKDQRWGFCPVKSKVSLTYTWFSKIRKFLSYCQCYHIVHFSHLSVYIFFLFVKVQAVRLSGT